MNIKILSRNPKLYSTQRLVEAAKKRKHNVQVIDPLKCDIIIEKRRPNIYYKQEYIKDVDAVIPRIGASVTFYGTAVVRQFEMMGAFTTVGSEALVRSRDKLRSLQVLSRAKIGLPKTVFTNYSKEVEAIIKQEGGVPLVIK
jgi:ribosomal protein S6--L-glutamate ligase